MNNEQYDRMHSALANAAVVATKVLSEIQAAQWQLWNEFKPEGASKEPITTDRAQFELVKVQAVKVHASAKRLLEANGAAPTRREVMRSTRISNRELTAAMDWMLQQSPAILTIIKEKSSNGKIVTRLLPK